MTRINIIEPSHLTDKHLVAEYKEITRPFNKMITRIAKYGEAKALDNTIISPVYILGTGHESFFFDKLKWLMDRYQELFYEMNRREFNVNKDKFFSIYNDLCDKLEGTAYWNWYYPSQDEMYLNMARLCKRSNLDDVLSELDDA